MPEDGELPTAEVARAPAQRGAQQQAAAQDLADRDGMADAVGSDGDSGGSGKRKHARIVWHTPPKAARGSGMAHVGSSKGLDGLGAQGGGGGEARTAADRAMEELAAFQQQQAAAAGSGDDDDGRPLMKPSPSVSSEEGEQPGALHCWGAWQVERAHKRKQFVLLS